MTDVAKKAESKPEVKADVKADNFGDAEPTEVAAAPEEVTSSLKTVEEQAEEGVNEAGLPFNEAGEARGEPSVNYPPVPVYEEPKEEEEKKDHPVAEKVKVEEDDK